MLTTAQSISLPECIRRLQPLLPDQAFAPCPRKLLYQAIHFLLIIGGYVVIGSTADWRVWILCSLVVGHSIACTGFFAHELSHKTIVRNPRMLYMLEVLCWGLHLISPTVWRRVHNQTHHIYNNTHADPDRLFFKSEACTSTYWYSRIFHPNAESPRWNFLVFFHFLPYIFRNTVAAFYSNKTKPTLVPAKPAYTAGDRIRVGLELLAILFLQYGIFIFIGDSFARFFFASPIALLITSSIVMSYILTNHLLNPLSNRSDPFMSTTSVVVYRIFDRLHLNFSYHTEHHLFPRMNSDYYPILSNLLTELYGDRYRRIDFGDAWNRLWKIQIYAADDNFQQDMHGSQVMEEGKIGSYTARP
jgi:fatty acid desaturase